MAIYNLTNVFFASDMTGLPADGALGTFTVGASAAKHTISVNDDDAFLQDNAALTLLPGDNTSTVDLTGQTLAEAFNGAPAGSDIYARLTLEVRVTSPTGEVLTGEATQIRLNGDSQTLYGFQFDVAPGSTVEIVGATSGASLLGGDTAYSDLDTSDDANVDYVYNQVITQAQFSALSLTAPTTYDRDADLQSMTVTDNDPILEDNTNSGQQTFDQNMQNLAADFGTLPAGSYVEARGYYLVTRGRPGDDDYATGRLYQLRILPETDGYPIPENRFPAQQFYAFANDFVIDDGDEIYLASPYINGLGNVPHEDLFVCYLSGTEIETAAGAVKVEELRKGDLVRTGDGFEPVRWVGRRRFAGREIESSPHLAPIRISAGALGDGAPAKDLHVSPQHRILVRSRIAHRMFDAEEILIPAKALLALEGVKQIHDFDEIEYVHFMFDRHELVYANGAPSESLYPGPQALKAVGDEARHELLEIFPALANPAHDRLKPPARPLAQTGRARKLVFRHVRNRRPILDRATA